MRTLLVSTMSNKELTEKNWLEFGHFFFNSPFSYPGISQCKTKSIFTPIRTYFNISSLRCDDVFHHFSILTNSKFTLRCVYLWMCVCVCSFHITLQLNLLLFTQFQIEMINFRYTTTFSGGGGHDEWENGYDMVRLQGVMERVAMCNMPLAVPNNSNSNNSSRMCFICGHTELMCVHTNISNWTGNWTKRK